VYGGLRRASLKLRSTDLGDIAQRAAALTTRSGASVVVRDSMPRVDCDRGLILDVLSRLIDNGLKFNESPRRQVEISWEADPNDASKCVIVVRDNGIGIRENHMAVLFRMFKRLNSRDAFGGGLGVGLAISK
jgi:light-regulated signal transduction histidine kinase (bacteriophytochrome)